MVTATATFAFDKKSARSFDADGRMRVRDCVISVAEVNPYYGKEIPKAAELGLTPTAVYDLYRDPEALALAADSFNGLPLMIRHVAQTADDPRKHDQAGSVYNARYADGKLRADLLVSDAKAIELIESGQLADLSSSYRYRADMTPVEVGGRKAHGSMRDIQGNHVALVEDGRATGAHVADSALSSPTGAPNVDPNTNPDTSNKVEGAEALMAILSRLEAIDARLTAVEGSKTQTPQSEAEVGQPASTNTANDEQSEKDREDESKGEKRSEKDREDERKGEERAMDAKSVQAVVAAAVKAERDRNAAVEAAKRATRGDLGDMIAMDSADEIYRAALKQRGVDVAAIPVGAEQAAYQAIQAVTSHRPVQHAHDSSSGAKPAFNTSRIRNYGRA